MCCRNYKLGLHFSVSPANIHGIDCPVGPAPAPPPAVAHPHACPTLTVKPSGWGTASVVKPHPDRGEAVRVGHRIGGEAPPPPHPPPSRGYPGKHIRDTRA